MIYKNTYLHNVSEISSLEDGGIRIFRFPEKARNSFDDGEHPYAVEVGQMTTGCEIRFVGEGADITISALDADGTVEIFRGDFLFRTERLPKNVKITLSLRYDPKFDSYSLPTLNERFDVSVWRVVFDHDHRVGIHSIEPFGEIRPPKVSEMPKKKILAYGSSITHSAGAGFYTNSYIYNVGRILGTDILCKGMGGSCFIQNEVADYIASEDWDAAIFELGVNMVDGFPVEVFTERASYLIENALKLDKPIILISNFTSYFDLPENSYKDINEAYVKALENIYERFKGESYDNLYYIRGRDIVTDFNYLLTDLIHPSPYGHAEMGRKIASKILYEFDLFNNF